MLMNNTPEATSTRPYLIRALYEWCTDNGFTPYLAVSVNEGVQVPLEFVQNGEIVLNVGLDATSSLILGNDFIEFKARFSGTAREIMVPVSQVMAIYARENGQGMSFPILPPQASSAKSPLVRVATVDAGLSPSTSPTSKPAQLSRVEKNAPHAEGDEAPTPPRSPPNASRPALKRVK
jgi:stringent starvation protein B